MRIAPRLRYSVIINPFSRHILTASPDINPLACHGISHRGCTVTPLQG